MKLSLRPRSEAPPSGPCFAVWLPLEGSQDLLGTVGQWTADFPSLRGVRLPSGGCLLRLTHGHFASPPPPPAIPCSYQRGLFVFADAEISPAFSEAEIKALAPYPRLFLSPSGSLCGWEDGDEFLLADLIQTPPPEPSGWHQPPEAPPWPSQMRGIVLESPLRSPEEILGEMGGDIGSEPLLLPEEAAEKPVSRRDFEGIQLGPSGCAVAGLLIVSLLFCALMLCASALGELTSGVVAILVLVALILLTLFAFAAKSFRSGATQQAEARAEARAEGDLKSRRRRAIEELLEELRHDRAAGLRKAIPFASGGGLGRGLAGAGAALGTRNTDFSLAALFGAGGGSFGSGWTLEQSLQEKLKHAYHAAAEAEAHGARRQLPPRRLHLRPLAWLIHGRRPVSRKRPLLRRGRSGLGESQTMGFSRPLPHPVRPDRRRRPLPARTKTPRRRGAAAGKTRPPGRSQGALPPRRRRSSGTRPKPRSRPPLGRASQGPPRRPEDPRRGLGRRASRGPARPVAQLRADG